MKKILLYLPVFILIGSLGIGAFFRFYKLGVSPIGFYIDEASIGYNAYSILKTGKDEFGKSFPVLFRSFSTFQSPVYTYLTIPSIAFFGLTPFSVRLPSALFGFLTIPLLFLLTKQLTSNLLPSTINHLRSTIRYLPSLSALFLATSPWHILYSRTAYEANIALFFLILGLLLLFESVKKPIFFIASTFVLSISMLAYRAEIFLVPVILLIFFVVNLKIFKAQLSKYLIPITISFILGLSILLPTLKIIQTPGFKARTSALSIFSNTHEFPWGKIKEEGILPNIINNRSLLTLREFGSLYTSFFSPRYLFSLGDSGPRKPYPDLGTFFVWQFPFYLLGLYFLIKDRTGKNFKMLVLTLLLASPVPAALTRDPYSTLRSLPMVIPLTIIVAIGLVKFLETLPPIFNKLKYLVLGLLIFFSASKMFISIFYHHDYYRSDSWSYGWQEAVDTIVDLDPSLPIIVDSVRGHPYIEILFFLNYDPSTYQKENFEVTPNEYYTNLKRNEVKKIRNITVKNFQWGVDTDRVEKYLITDLQAISDQQILEHNLTIVSDILYPNGSIALRILKTNPTQ